MKKLLVLLVFVSLISLPAVAQVSFGLKAAISDYNWVGDDWDSLEDLGLDNALSLGFSVGGFIEYAISDRLAIQPELLFTSASMKMEDSADDHITETWNMIEVPLYIKGLFPLASEPGAFYVMGGPDLFYILGDVDVESSVSALEGSAEPDNRLLFGLAIAAGYEFDNGVFVGLKYSREFSEYFDDAEIFIEGFGIEGGIKL